MSLRLNQQQMEVYGRIDKDVDMEGTLYMVEKKWLGRGENKIKRYLRLKGNLLFYFKNENLETEPVGVYVLEKFTVELDNDESIDFFSFVIKFILNSEVVETVKFFTKFKQERDDWMFCLLNANHEYLKLQIDDLNSKLQQFLPTSDSQLLTKENKMFDLKVKCCQLPYKVHINEFPTTYLSVLVLDNHWKFIGRTETILNNINPEYKKIISIPILEDGSVMKFTIYQISNALKNISIELCFCFVSISELKSNLEQEFHMECAINNWEWDCFQTKITVSVLPDQELANQTIECKDDILNAQVFYPILYGNSISETFEFESISTIDSMHESLHNFTIPKLYIQRLIEKYIECQEYLKTNEFVNNDILDYILSTISCYQQEIFNYETSETFKKSVEKSNKNKIFAPVNLHLERLEVTSSNETKFYDIWTSGAFTAFAYGYEYGGILSLIDNLKQTKDGRELIKVHQKYLDIKQLEGSLKFINDGKPNGVINDNKSNGFLDTCSGKASTDLENLVYSLLPTCFDALNKLQRRRDAVFSQAVTTILSGICNLLFTRFQNISIIKECGFLIYFESFLTCFGNEKAMLEDFIPILDDLERCNVLLLDGGEELKFDIDIADDFGGNIILLNSLGRTGITLKIFLPNIIWEKWKDLCDEYLKITVIFFTLGINEFVKIAKQTHLQTSTNKKSHEKLFNFYELHKHFYPQEINYLLRHLQASIMDPNEKQQIQLFDYAYKIIHLMKGLHFISCKSGKDRTSMRVTLVQAMILKDQHLVKENLQSILDCLRERGCRLKNTLKNTGISKYAFNTIQTWFLPEYYTPPKGTYGKNES